MAPWQAQSGWHCDILRHGPMHLEGLNLPYACDWMPNRVPWGVQLADRLQRRSNHAFLEHVVLFSIAHRFARWRLLRRWNNPDG